MASQQNRAAAPKTGAAKIEPAAPQQRGQQGTEAHPQRDKKRLKEKGLDKTLADSFPTSDPPSTIPDPCGEDSAEN